MRSKGRTAVAVAAGAVGALAVGWVIVPASADPTAAGSSSAVAAPTAGGPAAGVHKGSHHHKRGDRGDLLGGRLLHGQLTLRTPSGGTELAEVQRGQITAVSPTSITIKSLDGFTMTYVVNAQTKVRERGQLESISALSDQERAVVIGVQTGSTWTAKLIRGVPDAQTSPAAGTAGAGTGTGTGSTTTTS